MGCSKRKTPRTSSQHTPKTQTTSSSTPVHEKTIGVFGQDDSKILQSLRQATVVKVERGRGGRSLGFKITLADGSQGYFKPEQSFSAANWYAEIAAYHLDRSLGLGRVAPCTGRRIPWQMLSKAAGGDERIAELVIPKDKILQGALVWWITQPLVPLHITRGWEQWVRIEPWSSHRISPMTRPIMYKEALALRKEGQDPYEDLPPVPSNPKPDTRDRPQELSDLILFDYLIHNVDRWGGDNTNARTLDKHGPLIFFDNAAGFPPAQQTSGIVENRLEVVQRFRRSTIDAIKKFDINSYKQALATDPLAPVLTERDLEGLENRRKKLLQHVNTLYHQHGEEIFQWP